MRLVLALFCGVGGLLLAGVGIPQAGAASHAPDPGAHGSTGAVLLTQGAPAAAAATAEGLVDPREGGLQVSLGEWAVSMEAAAIRPGPVTFVIRNKGTRAHGFRIRSLSGRGRDRFERRTPIIPPGGERAETMALAPGTYRVDCFVTDAAGDHGGLGMRTMLTVSVDAPLLTRKAPGSASAVSIGEFAFSPEILKVPTGTTVTWTNADLTPHTITADDGSFDSGEIPAGGTFRRTFDRPGTFPYHCVIHPAMQGAVTAEP
jgi:plastocyanin